MVLRATLTLSSMLHLPFIPLTKHTDREHRNRTRDTRDSILLRRSFLRVRSIPC